MPNWLDNYFTTLREAPVWLWAVTIVLVLVVWFIPTFIALFRNRGWLRPIALLNVPGGLSWIVWTALIVWAASGKGPPPDLATNARKGWPWIAVGGVVIIAAIGWSIASEGA